MNNKFIIILSSLLGVIFVILAVIYWNVPAGSLPHLIPGFEAGSTTIHFKHGLASLILAILLFIFAWFQSGKKSN